MKLNILTSPPLRSLPHTSLTPPPHLPTCPVHASDLPLPQTPHTIPLPPRTPFPLRSPHPPSSCASTATTCSSLQWASSVSYSTMRLFFPKPYLQRKGGGGVGFKV